MYLTAPLALALVSTRTRTLPTGTFATLASVHTTTLQFPIGVHNVGAGVGGGGGGVSVADCTMQGTGPTVMMVVRGVDRPRPEVDDQSARGAARL